MVRSGGRAPSSSSSDAWSATTTRTPISLKDLEERFAGRALAWVGGIALVAAAIFFLSLAFSRGWITEPMRVAIGLTAGTAAFAAGAVLLARNNPLVGNVLAGVGLGIVSVSLFAATRLYGLLPPEAGLAGALVAAIAAAVVAVRYDARSVAAFGLIAALIAPPVMGASPTLLTLLFVAVTLAGSTAVSLFRSWRWLPSLAFVLAAPQLASWLAGNPDTTQAVVALTGFWLVNIIAAAGEEVRIRRDDLRPSSAILVLANATFLLWGIFVVLDGSLDAWRGFAIALASLAHLLVGGWFLFRQGWEHLFGNLVAGTGVALLAIAAFVQLGAPAVPVAWAAEAVALAWLAVRRRHAWSAGAGLILGGMAIAHLVVVEYPLREAGIPAATTFAPPLLNPEVGSLLAVLLALVVTAGLVPVRWIRSVLAGVGVLLVAYAVTFMATGPALAAALVLTGLAGLLLDRLVDRLPTDGRVAAGRRLDELRLVRLGRCRGGRVDGGRAPVLDGVPAAGPRNPRGIPVPQPGLPVARGGHRGTGGRWHARGRPLAPVRPRRPGHPAGGVGVRLPGHGRRPRCAAGRAAARRGRDRPRAGAAPGR